MDSFFWIPTRDDTKTHMKLEYANYVRKEKMRTYFACLWCVTFLKCYKKVYASWGSSLFSITSKIVASSVCWCTYIAMTVNSVWLYTIISTRLPSELKQAQVSFRQCAHWNMSHICVCVYDLLAIFRSTDTLYNKNLVTEPFATSC